MLSYKQTIINYIFSFESDVEKHLIDKHLVTAAQNMND